MDLFFMMLGLFGLCMMLSSSSDEEEGESTEDRITRLESNLEEIRVQLKELKEPK